MTPEAGLMARMNAVEVRLEELQDTLSRLVDNLNALRNERGAPAAIITVKRGRRLTVPPIEGDDAA